MFFSPDRNPLHFFSYTFRLSYIVAQILASSFSWLHFFSFKEVFLKFFFYLSFFSSPFPCCFWVKDWFLSQVKRMFSKRADIQFFLFINGSIHFSDLSDIINWSAVYHHNSRVENEGKFKFDNLIRENDNKVIVKISNNRKCFFVQEFLFLVFLEKCL